MKKQLNSNFITSSNLLLGAVGFGIIYLFLSKDILSNATSMVIEITTLLIIVGLSLFVRRGIKWPKYVLAVLTILFLIEASFFLRIQSVNLSIRVLFAIQLVLLAWATILLFKLPGKLPIS